MHKNSGFICAICAFAATIYCISRFYRICPARAIRKAVTPYYFVDSFNTTS